MGVLYPCHPRGARGRETREREPSVSGGTRRVALPRTASHSSLLVQSDASQEAERTNERTNGLPCLPCLPACFTARLAGRPADAPNLSYGQFVLFYSFIALANWRTLRTRLFRAWPLCLLTLVRTKERRSGDVCACVCMRVCVDSLPISACATTPTSLKALKALAGYELPR